MAPFGFEITKSVLWRGGIEQFSNVYHYQMGDAISEATGKAILDALVVAERPAFGTNVTFVQGRSWGPTDQGKANSNMVAVADYTGPGTQAGGSEMPYEETVVVQNYIGRGPAGHKQFLRKYLHICRCSSGDVGGPTYGNTAITANLISLGTTYWNRIKQITAQSNQWKLCSPKGKLYDNVADNPQVLPYVHIRQFRR